MTISTIFITLIALLKMTNSQYYSQPTSIYQPYSYYSSTTPTESSSMYAIPPVLLTPPPIFTPPFAAPCFTTSQSISTTVPASPGPTFPPSTYAPMPTFAPTYAHTTAYPQLTYPPPATFAAPTTSPTYAPAPAIPLALKYPATASPKPTSVSISTAPKCTPPTGTAYYLTTPVKTPKSAVKTEKVKENLKALSTPATLCTFCTGFANVPKNSKVPPPQPSSSVLPGIFDKIPTITTPDESRIKNLSKIITPSPLVSDLFECKLLEKKQFHQGLLDGFLTILGLEKCNDL